jgi:sarcosine oxidase subunit alpha
MSKQLSRREYGGRIDRSKPLSFTFDGCTYNGYAGDTLASALLANGIHLVGRSFKYHRPRGIYTAGAEEPNALVALRTGKRHEPNIPATMIELYEGLVAESQNRWPSLKLDLMSINNLFSPVLSAGFYYKTFMGPTRKSWMFYEKHIRNAAGMGTAPKSSDVDKYEKAQAFCDVLVVGAGPSGLSAALVAGRSGVRVVLVEDQAELGGSLLDLGKSSETEGWLKATVAELASLNNVRIMTRTAVVGAYDHRVMALLERVGDHLQVPAPYQPRQRLWTLRAQQVVLAAGMIERPLVFGNNDLPGIMLASAARVYVNRYGVLPGRKVVVFTNNDSAYDAALDISLAGASVTIVDVRHKISVELRREVEKASISALLGNVVVGAKGGRHVRGVALASYNLKNGETGRVDTRLSCDLLLISGGWTPTLHLLGQLGSKPVFDEKRATMVAGKIPEGYHLVGACGAIEGLKQRIISGFTGGAAAARACGVEASVNMNDDEHLQALPDERITTPIAPLWAVPDAKGKRGQKKFVDLQHDVKVDDIILAHREGFASVDLLKRYTTLGMANDQGKLANLNALALLSGLNGQPINAVGTTTFRPPYKPVAMGALAGQSFGQHFKPTRRTPMHDLHQRNGGVFTQTGLWVRPWYFLLPRKAGEAGETVKQAYIREAANVRKAVGLVDVSPLARSIFRGLMLRNFSTVSTSMPGHHWRWARHVTVSCCVQTAWWWMTAPPQESLKTITL